MNTFSQLIIFRELLQDSLLSKYQDLLTNPNTNLYYDIIHELITKDTDIKTYLVEKIIQTENDFTIRLENDKYKLTEADYKFLIHDLTILRKYLFIDTIDICDSVNDKDNLLNTVTAKKVHPIVEEYLAFFQQSSYAVTASDCDSYVELCRKYGIGRFAFYTAFYYGGHGTFTPITDFQPLPWEHIYGYSYQKDCLYDNTKSFIEGKPFHNTLLVGSSGTGKSSCVKAIAALFADRKLRLIQMQKGQLHHLPTVLDVIGRRSYRYIIFLDDLSFEANEDEYKFLKSFIEGSVMSKNENVAFYITSNRRHLIKEIRSERENDIHLNDFIQEMTSLSDRFGLTLFYESPDQKAFLEIVRKMLDRYNIQMPDNVLLVKSRQWSLEHGGMSGRTAEQFVKSVVNQI